MYKSLYTYFQSMLLNFDYYEKKARLVGDEDREYRYDLNCITKRAKNKFDMRTSGDNGRENFRINTLIVIMDKILVELTKTLIKGSLACLNFWLHFLNCHPNKY
jgi:hypothetical protein